MFTCLLLYCYSGWKRISIVKLPWVSENSIHHLEYDNSFQTPNWCCFIMETTRAPMHWWTTTEKSILATTLGIIIVFGVCGNLLVIIAILRFKRLRRAVNSYLILNLAVSDFLTASILMPFHLATVLDLNIIVDNGFLCKIGGILSYPFYICSTITLVMLAIERHIAVSDPLRYISRVTTRTIAIMIVYCWTQGVIFVVLVSSLANIEFSTQSLDCGVAWAGTPLWLSILALLLNIVLPFFLLLIMSLRVLIVAIRQKKRIDTERFRIDRTQRKKSVFSGKYWSNYCYRMSSYSNNYPEACFWALFVHYFSVLFCLQLVSNRRRRLAGELPANLRILTTNFYLRTKNNLKSFI